MHHPPLPLPLSSAAETTGRMNSREHANTESALTAGRDEFTAWKLHAAADQFSPRDATRNLDARAKRRAKMRLAGTYGVHVRAVFTAPLGFASADRRLVPSRGENSERQFSHRVLSLFVDAF